MNSKLKAVRKKYGLPEFEQECRVILSEGHRKKAYRVPGTPEAGMHAVLIRRVRDEMKGGD